MQIPEGYLSPYFCIGFGIIAALLFVYAFKKHIQLFQKKKIVALALLCVASFACGLPSMPVFCAVSLSVSLCVLIAVLFGPWTGFIASSIILLVQAILFGRGGISTFGANCFNIAFLQSFIGYGIYYAITRISKKLSVEVIGIIVGSFIAYIISSIFVGFEVGSQQLFFHDSYGHGLYAPFSLPATLISLLELTAGIWGIVQAALSGIALAFCRTKVRLLAKHYTTQNVFIFQEFKALIIAVTVLVVAVPFIAFALYNTYGEYSAYLVENNIGYVPAALASPWCFQGVFPQYHIGALPLVLSYCCCSLLGSAIVFGAEMLLYLLPNASTAVSTKKDNPAHSKNRVVYDEYDYEIDG